MNIIIRLWRSRFNIPRRTFWFIIHHFIMGFSLFKVTVQQQENDMNLIGLNRSHGLEKLNSVLKEKIRRENLSRTTELVGVEKNKINKKYEDLEQAWLYYWKNSKIRLEAFYNKHPKPMKKQYARRGISSFIFGDFDNKSYDKDSYNHYQKLNWLCTKIAEDSKALKIDFSSKCPGGCGKNTFFGKHAY